MTVSLGEQRYAAHRRGLERGVVLEAHVVDLLRGAKRFLTLEEHAAEAADRHGLDAEDTRAAYEDFVALEAAGLLLRYEDAEPKRSAVPPPPPIDRLGIMTCERPHLAQRAFESVVVAARAHDRPLTLTIHDDGETPWIPTIAGSLPSSLRVRIAGRADRMRFVKALAAEAKDVDPEVIRFAVLGDRTLLKNSLGANQNSAMLASAGHRFVCMDEDVEARSAAAGSGAALASVSDPTYFELYADVDEAIDDTPAEDRDHLAPHDRALGQKLFDVLGSLSDLEVERAAPRLLDAYTSDRGRVAATMTGLVGDSGMGASSYLYLSEGATRERFLADYEALGHSRAVRRAAPRLTVTDGAFLMTTHVGFDARALLPPFFTLGRNTDGTWGQTLRTVSPHDYIAYLPRWFVHRPNARALDAAMREATAQTIRLDEIVQHAIHGAQLTASTTEDALDDLGRHLVALSRLELDDFDAWLRARYWRTKAIHRAQLVKALEVGDGPPEWERDLETLTRAAEETLLDGAPLVPVDLARGMAAARGVGAHEIEPQAVREAMRSCLARFGATMSAWPRIVEAAKNLENRGVRLSRGIEDAG